MKNGDIDSRASAGYADEKGAHMSTINEISRQALQLPQKERATLARELLLSLEPEDLENGYEEAWIEELESRLAGVDEGRYQATDWREALNRIRNSISNGSS